jgi:hypothetical protein
VRERHVVGVPLAVTIEAEMLAHGQSEEDPTVLRDVGDPLAGTGRRRYASEVLAVYPHASRHGLQQP